MRYLDNVNQSITERRDIVIETAFKLFVIWGLQAYIAILGQKKSL